jgi:hypothetical protein
MKALQEAPHNLYSLPMAKWRFEMGREHDTNRSKENAYKLVVVNLE